MTVSAASFAPIVITTSLRNAIHAALHVGPKADAVIHHVFFHGSRPHIATSAVYHPDGREEYEAYELIDLPMYPYPGAAEGLYSGLPVSYAGHSYRLGSPVTFRYQQPQPDPFEVLAGKLAVMDEEARHTLAEKLAWLAKNGLLRQVSIDFLAAIAALLVAQEVAA